MKKAFGIVVLLTLVAVSGVARAAGTIYVDADATGAGDGSSWTDAYTDLQSALAVAVSGDEIWVAEGTYKPGAARTDSFTLVAGVGLYGGFDGAESVRSARDWEDNVTTLSGDIAGDNVYHVVYSSGLTETAVLDGFTVTAGQAVATGDTFHGGGMYNYDHSSPTVSNVIFTGNTADKGGGMANNLYSSPTVNNVIFTGNTAEHGGGMANVTYSTPTVNNVIFTGNTADYMGGGMYNWAGGNPTLNNVTFRGNNLTFAGQGGGISSGTSSPALNNCIVWSNEAEEIHGAATVVYSNIEGGYTGTGNINSDPLFVDAADLRLQSASPCIDAGDNSAVSTDVDLDGNPRRVDEPTVSDTGNGTAPIVDMGAYEVQFEAAPAFFLPPRGVIRRWDTPTRSRWRIPWPISAITPIPLP